MKCDNCKFNWIEAASMNYPYPWAGCLKGHWDGDPHNDETEVDNIDLYKDCADFKQIDKVNH